MNKEKPLTPTQEALRAARALAFLKTLVRVKEDKPGEFHKEFRRVYGLQKH